MKSILVLLLAAFTLSASAAQRFSFAGLVWGDSLATAETKLLAAGHSAPVVDPMLRDDPAKKLTFRRFTGKVSEHEFVGCVILYDGKLSQVQLVWDAKRGGRDYEDIQALFKTRYGKPRELGPPGYGWEWASSSGETLLLDSNMRAGSGSIFANYYSPEAMRRSREMEAKYKAGLRQQKMEAEAEQRKKAAGL